jgi:CHAT domain-containing protein
LYLNKKGVNEYEKAIRCAARLWEETGDEAWKAKMFEFMERGKCQVMLESIRRSRASYLAEIPENLRNRGIQLREDVNELFYQQSVGSPDSGSYIRSQLIQKRLDLDMFSDSLENMYPGYAEMTGQKKIVPMALIQDRFVGNSTGILEYFLGDSSLYVISLSPSGSTFRETELPAGFEDSLRHFFQLMQYPHPISGALKSYGRVGYELYQLLLEPELKGFPQSVNRLRIIPDGLLGLLPFDALPQGMGPKNPRNHGELPLLIFNYRVSYANSAALLAGAKSEDREPVECLGFSWNDQSTDKPTGQPRLIKGRDWPSLPGAGRELAQIKRMVAGAFFTGEAASESQFKSMAGDYGLLHLALHGNSGDEEPFIVFPSPGDSLEDGVLNLYELYNLPLKARLAVLSACETGSGALQRGEGIMSIASGFGSAGCPAVLMSVWPVDDQAGSHIMRGFYEGLGEGLPIDEALHRAKIAYMKSGGSYLTAPYYWAPFIVLGDVDPIPLQRAGSFNNWWWLGLGGVLLLLLGMLWRRKRFA